MWPYDPAGFVTVRLERDEKLAGAVENLERLFCAMSWTSRPGGTDRNVALALIEVARRHGTHIEGGIRVVKSRGDLQIEAKISFRRMVSRSITRL